MRQEQNTLNVRGVVRLERRGEKRIDKKRGDKRDKIKSIRSKIQYYKLITLLIVIVEKNLHAVRGPHKTDKNGILFLLLSRFFGVKEKLKTV